MSLEDIARNFAALKKLFSASRPKFDQFQASNAQFDRVTYEAVASQDPDGTVNVGGNRVATFGKVLVSPGEFVYVAWKGAQPIGILKFAWQKAHFAPVAVSLKKGIVEELFIANSDNGQDVFFRNYDQVTGLEIAKFIGAVEPTDVFWGVNEDVFGVMTGTDQFYVLKITRPELDKIISEGTKVRIKELLYAVKLSDITTTLTDVSVKLHRDSIEPVFQLDAAYSGFFPTKITLKEKRADNVNKADVTRRFTVKLTGASTISFVQSPSINEQGVRTGNVTASLVGVTIDENNDLIYSTSIVFNDFGIRQGNLAGLTGLRKKIGDGKFCTFGFVDTFAQAPHIIDDFPIMGFNLLDNNPGGELTAHVTETHSILINARTSAIIFSTLETVKLLEVHESADGQVPYFSVDYAGFFQAVPSPCGDSTVHAYVPDGHPVYNSLYGPITTSRDYGELGKYGVIRSDRSLFVLGLPFDPDGVPSRSVQILSNTQENTKFETERTDGFDFFEGHGNLFFSLNICAQAKWTNPVSDIKDRYEIRVTSLPFWATGNSIYHFVTVLRRPYNQVGSDFTNDPIQVGAFVLLNNSLVSTLLPYTTVTDLTLPRFMSGHSKHVSWRLANNWYITDLLTGVTTQIGTNADATIVQNLLWLNPDLLYSSLESKTDSPFFVKFIKDGVFQLNQSDEGFPRKEETPLDKLAGLKDLSSKLSPSVTSYQAIDDKALVPDKGTT